MALQETPFQWTCPYCEGHATLRRDDYKEHEVVYSCEDQSVSRLLYLSIATCPNNGCRKFALYLNMFDGEYVRKPEFRISGWERGEHLQKWALIPPSSAKSFPDYIPQSIRDNYTEACLIKDLSPKASAALARRCLQGMIRDFWGVVRDRLIDEINHIKSEVDPLTWSAIDAVRTVGNIGAHMEKDVNLIVDVEPKEAGLLIGLIERLIRDWYIGRHERELSLKELTELAQRKKAERSSGDERTSSEEEKHGHNDDS